MKPTIALIGPGRLGQAITTSLCQQGYPIVAVVGRDLERTRKAARFIGAEGVASTEFLSCSSADIILITTADDQLAATAKQIGDQIKLRQDVTMIHCSGLHTASILLQSDDRQSSPQSLSMHPLQTFASPELGLANLPGSYFSLEGDTKAIIIGQQLVTALGGNYFTIQAHNKALYHAAACMASNFITTVLDSAGQLLSSCSPDKEIPLKVLAPLVRAAIDNCLTMGGEAALTGPIVRADTGTIIKHMEQLRQHHPELLNLYSSLGLYTTKLAQRSQRLSDADAEQIKEVLTEGVTIEQT
ncbi:MAG: hypothetical protein B6I36_04910 [Desulfobacteraceae bacterium 4572_35.1]|nr:MAG: hypothetical protein B6I36_04910 [Desulfobacteraceae bacterium 4572_35.1]